MATEGDLMTEGFRRKMKIFRKRLDIFADEVKKIRNAGHNASIGSASPDTFFGMYISLESWYQKFENTFFEMSEFNIMNDSEEFPSTLDTALFENVKRYRNESATFHITLQRNRNPTVAQLHHTSPDAATNQTTITVTKENNLPEIKLPHFSGNITDWPFFRDAYVAAIHSREHLSNIEKFSYLIGQLRGPALDYIKAISLSEENYNQAWHRLKERYDNQRHLSSAYISKILTAKPIQQASVESLEALISEVITAVDSFKALTINEREDYLLFEIVVRYVDPSSRQAFEQQHIDHTHPTFAQLKTFLERRLLQLSRAAIGVMHTPSLIRTQPKAPSRPNNYQPKLQTTALYATPTTNTTSPLLSSNFQCFVCKQPHVIQQCSKFLTATPQQRITLLSKWTGCRNCLCPKHRTKQCISSYNCRTCNGRHHTLLHMPQNSYNQPPAVTSAANVTEKPEVTLTSTNFSKSTVILGTAVARIQDGKGIYQQVRLVLDSGSQNSFVTTNCAERLGLAVEPTQYKIAGLSNTTIPQPEGVVKCTIRPLLTRRQYNTRALVISTITPPLPREPIPEINLPSHLLQELADPEYDRPGSIDFLLGADLFNQILSNTKTTHPLLLSTVFGQVVMGSIDIDQNDSVSLLSIKSIEKSVHRFWEAEEITIPIPPSEEDRQSEEFFRRTTYREESGRYVVALPFRKREPILDSSRSQALNRLYSMENKLAKNSDLKIKYHEFMQEYLDLGHMQLATSPSRCFLPHHAVVKQGTDKLRVVFDGSARSFEGSLNSHLFTGPQLHNGISDIIVRFRRHRIVFTADVIKMYRQILIHPPDRSYQHILWRFRSDESVETYQLNTVTYGLTSSPYQAMRVLRQLVEDDSAAFPSAAAVILNDMYVDDVATGAHDIPSAIDLKNQLKALLSKACMQLSKWTSNAPEVIEGEEKLVQTYLNLDEEDASANIKILGLRWAPATDTLSFSVEPPTINNNYTKRTILSTIARLYDPLGFVAPVIFSAKLILQDIWKGRCDWDEDVPDHIQSKWSNFLEDLGNLRKLSIPRYYGDKAYRNCQIVGFCDASEHGYCAVIYLCVNEQVTLIKAKTKVAPLKTLTIPRLELLGAVLLGELLSSIKPLLQTLHSYETFLFTDSSVVLSWLATPPHILKIYVAHRVVHLLELTELSSWRHVKTSDNPADCGSRGLLPTEILDHSLWWTGPSWLTLPFSQWPVLTPDVSTPPECRQEYKEVTTNLLSISNTNHFIQWTERFSIYNRLIRSFAYVCRVAQLAKNRRNPPEERTNSGLTSEDVESALQKCIILIQHHYFPHAYSSHQSKGTQLQQLGVFLDDAGLLRVGGRLKNATLNYDQTHPILLPGNAHFSTLLVRHYHKANLHIGCAALQATIQRRFWITSLRSLCRKIKRRCIVCIRLTTPSSPYMGELPSIRFSETNAFHNTAVDFAGPFLARETTRRKSASVKVYLVLFICLSTKAVHLEIAHGLSTEDFINVLDRFIARRGRPMKFLSDCGTNFVGTVSYFRELCDWIKSQTTQDSLTAHATNLGISWDFNPPRSPHFGGIFEAGIKSAKTLLSKFMSSNSFTVQELSYAFTRIEAILNSRPLYPTSNDPDDCQPITPGHFLIGRPITAMPEPPLQDIPSNRLSRWQLIRERTQTFWKLWRDQYLKTFYIRRKWYKHYTNFKIGDIVLMRDSPSSPYSFPYAKVTAVYPGPDGVVRVVTLLVAGKTMKRSVHRLISLAPLLEE